MVLGIAAAVAFLFFPGWASASPTARLVYVRGPGAEACPEEAELRAEVAGRLGYDPFRLVADNTLSAEVRGERGVLYADVKLVDKDNLVRGARHLTTAGKDCSELTAAMSLSMSIALDPLSLTRAPTPPEPAIAELPLPDAGRSPPPTLAPAEKKPASSALPKAAGPAIELGGGIEGSLGSAPSAAAGLTGFAGLRWAVGSLDLGGRVDFPASRPTAAGTVRTSLTAAWASGCVHYAYVLGCAVLEAGSLQATAEIASPISQSSFFLAVGPRVGALLPIASSWDLGVWADLFFLLTPYSLGIDRAPVYTSSPVSAALSLAAVFHFP